MPFGLVILFLGDAGSELMDFWQCWVNVWIWSGRFFPPRWFHDCLAVSQPSLMNRVAPGGGCRSRISWVRGALWVSALPHCQHSRRGLASGDSADSPLLPCLQWPPSASREGELPQASLGRSGWSEASPSPQHPSLSGLGGSGVTPVVNWEETWVVNVIIFVYLFILKIP